MRSLVISIFHESWTLTVETNAKVYKVTNGYYGLVEKWFGHVSRSSGLAKTILQGTVKGKRKRGRQKKRWEDIE